MTEPIDPLEALRHAAKNLRSWSQPESDAGLCAAALRRVLTLHDLLGTGPCTAATLRSAITGPVHRPSKATTEEGD